MLSKIGPLKNTSTCSKCTISMSKRTIAAYDDTNQCYCVDCAKTMECPLEFGELLNLKFSEVKCPDIQIDMQAQAPVGFIKALRYATYTQYAYKIGYEHGKRAQ